MGYGKRYAPRRTRRFTRRFRPKRRVPVRRTRRTFNRRRNTTFQRMARHGPQKSSYKYLPKLVRPTAAVEPALGLPFRTVRLRYVETYNLTAAGANIGNYWAFRANSIYDPDYSYGGHQPMGRDVWASIYSEYRVRRFYVNLSMANRTDTITRVVTFFTDDLLSVPFANFLIPGSGEVAAMLEQKNPHWGIRTHLLGGTDTPNEVYRSRKNEARFVDLKEQYKRTEWPWQEQWTAMETNPLNPYYFFISIMPEDMVTLDSSVRFNVSISYDVEFKGQKVRARD